MGTDGCRIDHGDSKMRKVWNTAGLLLAALLFGGMDLAGQVTTATLHGIVTDSSDAAVPSATVTLTNVETNQAQTKTTNEIASSRSITSASANIRSKLKRRGSNGTR